MDRTSSPDRAIITRALWEIIFFSLLWMKPLLNFNHPAGATAMPASVTTAREAGNPLSRESYVKSRAVVIGPESRPLRRTALFCMQKRTGASEEDVNATFRRR